MNDSAASSGMGACGFVGQIGVYIGRLNDIAAGTTVRSPAWIGWIQEGDLKLEL